MALLLGLLNLGPLPLKRLLHDEEMHGAQDYQLSHRYRSLAHQSTAYRQQGS